jgi:hypothetical protein
MEFGSEVLEAPQFWRRLLERGTLHYFEFDWTQESTEACYAFLTYGLIPHFVERFLHGDSLRSARATGTFGDQQSGVGKDQARPRLVFWCTDSPLDCLVPHSIRELSCDNVEFTEELTSAHLERSEHNILVLVSMNARVCCESAFLRTTLLPALLCEKMPQRLTLIIGIRPGEHTTLFLEGVCTNATSRWKFRRKGYLDGWVRVPQRNRCEYFCFQWELTRQRRFQIRGRKCNLMDLFTNGKSSPSSAHYSQNHLETVNEEQPLFSEREAQHRRAPNEATNNHEKQTSDERAKTSCKSIEYLSKSLPFRVSLSDREERARARVQLPFEHFDESRADSIMKSADGFVIYENAEAEEPGSDPEVSSDEDLDV